MTKYPAAFETLEGVVRLAGELDFTDPANQPPPGILTVVLTNAQILAMPTTPAVLMPATSTPNYASTPATMPIVTYASAILNNAAGAYTNVTNPSKLVLCWGADESLDISPATIQGAAINLHDQFDTNARRARFYPFEQLDFSGGSPFTNNVLDNGVYMTLANGAGGDLTGGNVANTLTVRLEYLIVSL